MFELEKRIRGNSEAGGIQLMAHLVAGYPDFKTNREVVSIMVESGVEFIEIQIPFSEPMADGPTIVRANLESLKNGTRVAACFDLIAESARKYPRTGFVAMSYANIPFRMGFEKFAGRCSEVGALGAIIPDLPPERAGEYFSASRRSGFSPVHILTPSTPPERMKSLSEVSEGMLYCVGRTGVTGKQTRLGEELEAYLKTCRENVALPLGVGFGIRTPQDVAFLKGKADIAILGSRLIEIVDGEGPRALEVFLKNLRSPVAA